MFRTTLRVLFPLLGFFTRLYPLEHSFEREPTRLQFELRHQHAVSPDAHIVFADIPQVPTSAFTEGNKTTYTIKTRRLSSFRPPSFRAHEAARIRSIRHAQSADLPWHEDEIVGPDVEDRETLLELAKMTNNAYVAADDAAWYKLRDEWNIVRRLRVCSWMTTDVHLALSVWLGTRRGRDSRLRLCDARQFDRRAVHQGFLDGVIREWRSDGEKGQGER